VKRKICVIGAGRWGENHIKTLFKLNALGGVVDKNKAKLKSISEKYPECELSSVLDENVIKKFDGFVIATEPSFHFELAKKVILGSKPVLVEKPLTLDYNTSKILCQMSKEMNVNLMVGHVLLFHPAFIKMKELIEGGKIGKIQYIYSNRLNMGTFRTNENVFWSFAPHDIALLNYFFDESPLDVNSSGIDILQKGIHDTSITTFDYHGKKMAHIFVSWLHPFKEHRFVVIGSSGMLHFEDTISKRPLLYYKNKVEFINNIPNPSKGEVKQIDYSNEKPLTNELKYFLSNMNKKIEIASGEDGLAVVKTLEKASINLVSS
tara:strand:- start:1294 stop:2253 length:960 start_codon:yes stop_codon:yes gene_type:complete